MNYPVPRRKRRPNSVHGMSVSSAPLGRLTLESVSKSSDGVADVAHATRRAHATP